MDENHDDDMSLDLSNKQSQSSRSDDVEDHSEQLESRDSSAQLTQTSQSDVADELLEKLQPVSDSSTDSLPSREPRVEADLKAAPLFRESKISIAVDVSGSTYGAALEAEVRAIRDICSLFPREKRSNISILPWSHYASRPISLDQLDELDPDGDTKPSVLLNDGNCRYELQNSSSWFLLTDGDILDPDVRQFARELVEYGVHGLACVVAIFGEREQTPANCNVSVGLSVFAVSPHCAFLYTDIGTNETYVLQTKGCFSALLPKGKSNPILKKSTRWADLPRTSYENLARVHIPPPQPVSKDEVVLGDNSRLNLSNLLSSPDVDMGVVERILENEDNLKTIALTAKLKGQTAQLSRWLDSVEKATAEASEAAEVDRLQDTEQSDLLVDAMAKLLAPESTDEIKKRAQREIHDANVREQELRAAQIAAQAQNHRRTASWTHCRAVSGSSFAAAGENISAVEYGVPPPPSVPRTALNLESVGQNLKKFANRLGAHDLFTPGFQKPEFRKDFFKGQCNLCASKEQVMALLLRSPPDDRKTVDFPLPQSSSQLLYPLTMGNYAETDIVSSVVACDPCSHRIAKKGQLPSGETIVAALPLVSFMKNRLAWSETINVATQKRFHQQDLPLVFLSIMYTKMERILGKESEVETLALRSALGWACSTLLREVQITPKLDSHALSTGSMPSLLEDHLLQMFKSTHDDALFLDLLKYPLDGFVVANVALSESLHKISLSAQKRKRIVFFRFLYYLAEQYQMLASECDGMVLEALKILMLQWNDSAAPLSLLDLERMRQFSSPDAQSMLENLQQRFGRRPKKGQHHKLSMSVNDLLKTPMLDEESWKAFRRLGGLFSWIDDQAGHAIAAFIHYLFCIEIPDINASVRFSKIRTAPEMRAVMSDPGGVSAKTVEGLIKKFSFLPSWKRQPEIS